MRILKVLCICLLLPIALTACCGTIYKDINSANDLTPDSVIVVGRIELIPKLKVDEQDINIKHDLFGVKDRIMGRAILYLSSKMSPGQRTRESMNPAIEQTFFVGIPKNKRYMVEGMVMMSYNDRLVSRRQVAVDTSELIIPPAEFDIRPSDRAIYIGTLRLHRDEYFTVTKAEVVDDYKHASAEFRKKFGRSIKLRKALAKSIP